MLANSEDDQTLDTFDKTAFICPFFLLWPMETYCKSYQPAVIFRDHLLFLSYRICSTVPCVLITICAAVPPFILVK